MACTKDHTKIQDIMASLPFDQGGIGRHKCAACAYDLGYVTGSKLDVDIDLRKEFDLLEDSQAQAQRHKSPHAAFAKGYLDGVMHYYSKE